MKKRTLLAVFAAFTLMASTAAMTSCDLIGNIPVVGPFINGLFGGEEEEVTLKSIKLDAPDKTTYVWGEAFDPTGMVVTANYSDGSKKEIPAGEYTMSIAAGTKLTENVDLVVTYQDQTAKKAIKVTNPAVAIEIKTHATKLNYIPGQHFDPAGLVLAVKYTDGTQKEIVVAEDSSVTYSKDPLKATDTQFEIKIGDVVVIEELSFGYGLFVEAETALINSTKYTTPTDGIPSTSGGSYVGNMFAHDSISFLFTADKAGKADIAFVLASLYLKRDNNWTPYEMGDCQFNLICEFYVNGVKYDIPDSVILPGGVNEEGSADLWTNWQDVTFENVDLIKGANSIKLKFIPHNYTDTSQSSFSGSFTANVDCLTVNTEDIVLTKMEAEDLVINSVDVSNAKLEIAEDAAYIVLEGSVDSTYPECELPEAVASYGFAVAAGETSIGNAEVTVTGTNFVAKIDVSGAAEGAYAIQANGAALEVVATAGEGEANYRKFTLAADGALTVVSTAKITNYKPTSVKLEEVEGSVYFVIEGAVAWEGYESAADAEAVLLPLLGFDFQGDLASSSSNNRYLANAADHDVTFTAGEGSTGTYKMMICVDSLTGAKYSTHFGYKADGKLANLDMYSELSLLAKEAVDLETVIHANHKLYQLAYEPEYSSANAGGPGTDSTIRKEHYYGCVGLTIVGDGSVLEIALPEFISEEVKLVEENGKPILNVVGTTTITMDGYTLEEVAELIAASFVGDENGNLNPNGAWGRMYPSTNICELTAIDGVENGYKFVVKMDLSDEVYTLGYTYMVKALGAMTTSGYGGNAGDVKLQLTFSDPATEEELAHATQVVDIRDTRYTLWLANDACWGLISFKSEANPDWVEPSIEWGTTTSASLEVVEDKAYFVIERPYTAVNYTAEEIKVLAEAIAHDFERLNDWKKPKYQSYVVVTDTAVKHYLDVSGLDVSANQYVCHYDKASGIYGNDGNYSGAISETANKVIANGKAYSLVKPASPDWATNLTTVQVSELEGYSFEAKGVRAELKAEGDKALYVIHGTVSYEGWTAEEVQAKLEGLAIDFQGNPYVITGTWGGDWEYYVPELVSVVMNNDGTYVATYDLTDLYTFAFTGHYAGGDFKPAEAYDASVTVGGRTYHMVVVPGSGDGAEYWGCVGLRITEAA